MDDFKDFQEMVEYATCQIHSALLEGGGTKMRGAVHTWMAYAIRWNEEKKKAEEKKGAK